ncbi:MULTISPECIES: hypothetical protein [unclassified Flavobacterium]|uniref:hypothetical protein n=1 Tax=unclassified Flavobacterium TaxID=196869 RepID=UPI00131BA1D8|nr:MULTISPECIES: hypothetical protein [unclassified Flavobacterium]
MKTKLLLFSVMTILLVNTLQAQDRTSVSATNAEISDNLDLRAIASIFGDSKDLDDFERRLNDPKAQISNLDLNNDNQVDYLRVVESVESNTHLIVVQAVLERDVYQDVATIDVERDRNNKVQVQVIGDVYMYGENYIYEPVYYTTPVIYASFWRPSYRAYTSRWNWGYYPSYYYTWNPFPVFRYRNNISICLNSYNSYNYVNYRSSSRSVILYNSRRCNSYEKQYPNYAFSRRNVAVSNRYELDQRRTSYRVENSYGRRTTDNGYNTDNTRGNRTTQNNTSGRYESQGRTRTESNPNSNRIATSTENNRYSSRTNGDSNTINSRSDRSYSQNRGTTTTERESQRSESPRANSSSRSNSENSLPSRRESTPREYSQNRTSSSTQVAPQRQESSSRGNSDRGSETRGNSNQRGSSERLENRRS